MHLRDPKDLLVRDMNYMEVRDYIFELEEEVKKLRNLRRLYRKQMREMQHVLEQKNYRKEVLDEWKMRKNIESNRQTYEHAFYLIDLHNRNNDPTYHRKEIE
jgi:hypothetical protein